MQNDWGALGMGGVGRVDIRGATPPIGNTGPGGVEGMGLLALLRRLSMGLDEGSGSGLPTQQMTPDPAAQSGLSNALGGGVQGGGEGFPEGFDPVQALAGQMPQPMPAQMGQMGQPGQPAQMLPPSIPVAPSPGGMAGMMATEPGQEDQWAELRRLGIPY